MKTADIAVGHSVRRCWKKQSASAMRITGDAKMARNVSKKILHASACSFCFSLGMMIVLSCMTVAPAIESYCEVLFCFLGIIFVISLCIFIYGCVSIRRFSDRMARTAYERQGG